MYGMAQSIVSFTRVIGRTFFVYKSVAFMLVPISLQKKPNE